MRVSIRYINSTRSTSSGRVYAPWSWTWFLQLHIVPWNRELVLTDGRELMGMHKNWEKLLNSVLDVGGVMNWVRSCYSPGNKVGGVYWNHPFCLSVCPTISVSRRYLLNYSTFRNQTWYSGASSWNGESGKEIGFLLLRSRWQYWIVIVYVTVITLI